MICFIQGQLNECLEANGKPFDFLFPSVFDAVSMEADEGLVQQISEENERSSAVLEEKALSDSEIKVLRFCLAVIPTCSSYTAMYFIVKRTVQPQIKCPPHLFMLVVY